MRIYLCGQKLFGAGAFGLCQRLGHEIVGVSAPLFAGDGKRPDRLRAAAMAAGTRHVMIPGMLNADTLPPGIDLIIAAHSHDFIGRKTRQAAKLGALGYHPSLLPLHRGRDAVRWAIRMRDRVTGGSVFWLNDNVDGGDIAAQEHVFIEPGETAESLWRDKLFPLGLRLFEMVLRDLGQGLIIAVPQNQAVATWEPSIDRSPLYRPDLPQLGRAPEGFQVIRDTSALHAGPP